jgi:hypothetical protein
VFLSEGFMIHTTATRTAIANAIKGLIDGGSGAGVLRLRAGSNIVASIELGDPCGVVTDGVLVFSGFPREDLSAIGGVVDNAQVLDSDLVVLLTLTAGISGDVILSSANIGVGAQVQIVSASYTASL